MRKKIFTFLLALAASVGMSWADTYVTIAQNDFPESGNSFTKDGVTVSVGSIDRWSGYLLWGGSFSTTLGNFTHIEVMAGDVEELGEGWSGDDESQIWSGNASSVSFSGNISSLGQGITLLFTIGDPAPTYTVALKAGTVNADKVTLSATSAEEGATVTVTPDEEYEITAFSAKYNTTEEAASTLDPATGAYSFTMPAYAVTIEATIAEKAAPQPAGNVVIWNMSMDAVNGIVEQNETKEVFGGITIAAGAKRAFMMNGNANALLFAFSNSQAQEGFKGFTFANTLGVNFKKIVLSGAADAFNGKESTGWVINEDKSTITWEGDAASVSIWETLNFIGPIIVNEVEFTLEGGEPAPTPAEDVNITPNADPENPTVYYSTFFDSANKYALPAGVEAYVADLSGANLLLSKIAEAGEVIPANVAVILKSSVDPFTLTVSDADAVTFTATNDLQGSDTQIATPANCYVLAGTDGVVGFYHYTAANLNAHKAYVVYSGSNQAPRRMPFIFDQATGVENVQGDNVQSTKVIENGQLIIIRNGVRYNAAGQNVK